MNCGSAHCERGLPQTCPQKQCGESPTDIQQRLSAPFSPGVRRFAPVAKCPETECERSCLREATSAMWRPARSMSMTLGSAIQDPDWAAHDHGVLNGVD